MKIYIKITLNNTNLIRFSSTENQTIIECGISNTFMNITDKNIDKIKQLLLSDSENKELIKYYIIFKDIDTIFCNNILTRLHNIIYQYYPNNTIIKIYNTTSETKLLLDELKLYKDIMMDPNKNPDTYLEYVLGRIPETHYYDKYDILKTTVNKDFPLTSCVGMGSSYNAYFVHIKPKISNKNMDIYLVGKAITYDSGGLDLKSHRMNEMKTDMGGSAVILSVLNLLKTSHNIHLIIPIVENMISNTATRPGMVIKSISGKLVEIADTDAEGRLCLAEGIEFVNKLITNPTNTLIIDIATLTGNTTSVTNGVSSIIMGNKLGRKYIDQIIQTGEDVMEYVDYLQLRNQYNKYLSSNVADISNHSHDDSVKCGSILGGTFIKYFTRDDIPWIHMDVASNLFVDNMATSYGINLLYSFIERLTYETI
jgi:leucyl aminopeptidase